MTNTDFATTIAYITSACGKPLTPDAQVVYFDLLRDLPADLFQLAAKRVLLEHRWATFPSIAELRQAASESARGVVAELTPAEAWRLAWEAAGKIDPEQAGSADRHLTTLPPLVREAVVAFGVPALCYGSEPVGVVRGQFLKIFEQLQGRERRGAMMPPTVRQEVEDRRGDRLPAIVGTLAERFAAGGAIPG